MSGSHPERRARTVSKGISVQPLWALLAVLIVVASAVGAWLQPPHPHPGAARSLAESFWYPVERQAQQRLPAAPSAISAVRFLADARHGWAVGNAGAILATSDGGKRWTAHDSGVSVSLGSLHVNADGRRAWAAGESGTILHTQDAGVTWRRQHSATTAVITGIHFDAKGERGWALGSDGTVFTTTDSGRSWTPRTTGRPDTLRALHVHSDGLRAWAVGNGVILMTDDGGVHWHPQRDDLRRPLYGVHFHADGQRGWAVGDATLLMTVNGGQTWTSQLSRFEYSLRDVYFDASGERGWVVGTHDTLLVTTDGGTSWHADKSAAANTDLYGVYASRDGRNVWVVGSGGTIVATQNAGRTWAAQTAGAGVALYGIHLDADGKRAWAVGGGGSIIATTNGGENWVEQSSGVRGTLRAVHFHADGVRGWAVGDDGVIVATRDAGRSWTARRSGARGHLMAVHFHADARRGWAVSNFGPVLATTDGGRTWSAQPSGNLRLLSLHFHQDGQLGWAVGDGVIVKTTDGGRTWSRISPVASDRFNSVFFDAAGVRGWIGGSNGAVWATADAGESWQRQATNITSRVTSIRFDPEGPSGWAVTNNGTILRSSDHGATWRAQDSKVGTARLAVAFDRAGNKAWAVGYPPALLKTADGGSTWTPMPWPFPYSRYPAPWFWASLIVACACLCLAVRRIKVDPHLGAEVLVTTDKPLSDFARDRLQFGPVARGISRFLRNLNTEPPLTLAISGDWGSGKSSLMELVSADLRRYGGKPVWFNAWHHQNEEQLLAALLTAVRDRGLPGLCSTDGWVFRFRLLWMRSKKHFALAFALLLAASAVVAYMATHDQHGWAALAGYLGSLLSGSETKPEVPYGRVTAQVVSASTAIFAIYRAVKAFGVDPAVLLVSTAKNFKLRDATAQTNFRTRFAEQFKEVTHALPYPLVIVIDDLDRCRPETVLDIMESVNFLVSSGRCFVLFGMATQRVQAALSLPFEKISKELVELDSKLPADASPDAKESAERERRRAYVRDYLEKLVNLEITVPDRKDIPPHRLVEAIPEDATGHAAAVAKTLLQLSPLWLAAVAIGVGTMMGSHITVPEPRAATVQASVAAKEQAPSGAAAADAARSAAAAGGGDDVAKDAAPRYVPAMQDGDSDTISWGFFGIALALFVFWAIGFMVYRLRSSLRQVHDSVVFAGALAVWLPVVQKKRGTPRGIKRFANRVRYLAMLQQVEAMDESGLDLVSSRFRLWRARLLNEAVADEAPSQDSQSHPGLEEHRLVALSTLYEIYGAGWRGQLQPTGESPLDDAVRTAIAAYVKAGATWPPSAAELERFELALKGVRLTADRGTRDQPGAEPRQSDIATKLFPISSETITSPSA